MRLILAAAVGAVALAGGASAGPDRLDLPDFAYSLSIRNYLHKSAVCVARSGDARGSWRLAGLGYHNGTDWAPGGDRVAVALERPGRLPAIWVAEAYASGGFRAITAPRRLTEEDWQPDWSPDGSRIAFERFVGFGPGVDYGRTGLWVVEVGSRRERQLSRRSPGSTSWSPRGDRLAVRFESDLSVFTAAGRLEWTISRGEESFGEVAWSPSGDVLAARFDREVLVLTPSRTPVATIVLPETPLAGLETGLSWSPDGTRLAVGGGGIYTRSGSLVGRYGPPSTMDAVSYEPQWTPDGTAIVFERARAVRVVSRYSNELHHRPADLYVVPAAGGDATALTATPDVDEGGVVIRPGRVGGTAGLAVACVDLGTSGRNVIYGSDAEDLISAGPGNDVVYGRGGADVIFGGNGNDALYPGRGADQVVADAGRDRIYARDSTADRLAGGPGFDRAWIDRRRDSFAGIERVFRR
jgi:dipeptidyl aminopeptidase/acylaminoacyl peptidase